MNAKNLIAAVAVFAATGSAFAQASGEFVDFVNISSTKSRAEVKAELAQAARQSEYVDFSNIASETPRNAVRAEVKKAYDSGLMNDRKEYVEFVNIASTRSRDEVRKEALAVRTGNAVIGS